MFYAKELAPNLFNSYTAWYKNYCVTCDTTPSKEAISEAKAYFHEKEGD